jgi:phage terminase large subunit-like protein
MLYEWPEAMIEAEAYLEPENFYVTNPNLGRSSASEWLDQPSWSRAGGRRRGEPADIPRQASERRDRAAPAARPLARRRLLGGRGDRTLTLENLLERCEVAVIGGDGGGLDDLYGLCVAGREKGTDRWLYWFEGMVLARSAQAPQGDRAAARGLRRRRRPGHLQRAAAAGRDDAEDYALPQDIAEFVAICVKVKESGKLPENAAIGLDAAMATDLTDALEAVGFTVADGQKGEVVAIGQGFRLMSAIVGLARKLKFGGAVHSGSR